MAKAFKVGKVTNLIKGANVPDIYKKQKERDMQNLEAIDSEETDREGEDEVPEDPFVDRNMDF